MHNPYSDVIALAMRAVSSMPRLTPGIRTDAANDPSDASERARNARLAAALIARTQLRCTVERRGDYSAIVGAPMPEHFHTY